MNAKKKIFEDVALVDNPHPSSRAAYILLYKTLSHIDCDSIVENYYQRVFIKHKWIFSYLRQDFLKQNLKENKLYCRICGKKDLDIVLRKNRLPNLATIEHIVPISLGGHRFNKKNWTITCFTCNRRRGCKKLLKHGNMYLIQNNEQTK